MDNEQRALRLLRLLTSCFDEGEWAMLLTYSDFAAAAKSVANIKDVKRALDLGEAITQTKEFRSRQTILEKRTADLRRLKLSFGAPTAAQTANVREQQRRDRCSEKRIPEPKPGKRAGWTQL